MLNKIYLRAKFWTSSSKMERVMLNFMFLQFLRFYDFKFFGCGRSRSICMQNVGLLAQKLSELCSFLCFLRCFYIFTFYLIYIFTFFSWGRSRSTCLQNFGLLAQKLSELCSILFSGKKSWIQIPLKQQWSLYKWATSTEFELQLLILRKITNV